MKQKETEKKKRTEEVRKGRMTWNKSEQKGMDKRERERERAEETLSPRGSLK